MNKTSRIHVAKCPTLEKILNKFIINNQTFKSWQIFHHIAKVITKFHQAFKYEIHCKHNINCTFTITIKITLYTTKIQTLVGTPLHCDDSFFWPTPNFI